MSTNYSGSIIIDLKHAELKYKLSSLQEVLAFLHLTDNPTEGEINYFAQIELNPTEDFPTLKFMNELEASELLSTDSGIKVVYVTPDKLLLAEPAYSQYCSTLYYQKGTASDKEVEYKKTKLVNDFFGRIDQSIIDGTLTVEQMLPTFENRYEIQVGKGRKMMVILDETQDNIHKKVIFTGLHEALNEFLNSNEKSLFFTKIKPIIVIQRNKDKLTKLAHLEQWM